MALTIVDSGASLLITDGAAVYTIPKSKCFPQTKNGTDFFITEGIGWTSYTLIETPAGSGSAAALVDTINAMLDTASETVTVAASENHLGAMGGNTNIVQNTITTTNGTAYTANDNIGGIITVAALLRLDGGTGVLQELMLWSKENQKPNLYIDFWKASPSVGTYTNDAAQVIAGDEADWIGFKELAVADWKDSGTISRCVLSNLSQLLAGYAADDIFITIETKTAITYTSTSGLIVKAGIFQD